MYYNSVNVFKELINKKFLEVTEAFPSLYTKDDVIKLLNGLSFEFEQEMERKENYEKENLNVKELCKNIREELEQYYYSNHIDYDSAELDLNGNEISLCNVRIDEKQITDDIIEIIENNLNK